MSAKISGDGITVVSMFTAMNCPSVVQLYTSCTQIAPLQMKLYRL